MQLLLINIISVTCNYLRLIQRCNSSNETVRLGKTWFDESLSVRPTQIVIPTHIGKSERRIIEVCIYHINDRAIAPVAFLVRRAP